MTDEEIHKCKEQEDHNKYDKHDNFESICVNGHGEWIVACDDASVDNIKYCPFCGNDLVDEENDDRFVEGAEAMTKKIYDDVHDIVEKLQTEVNTVHGKLNRYLKINAEEYKKINSKVKKINKDIKQFLSAECLPVWLRNLKDKK